MGHLDRLMRCAIQAKRKLLDRPRLALRRPYQEHARSPIEQHPVSLGDGARE
jgi:hypothetical protein